MIAPRLFAAWILQLLLLGSCSPVQDSAGTAPGSLATRQTAAGPPEPAFRVRHSRAACGDTVSLPHRELAQFLPVHIEGFVREGAVQGESVQLAGISYSTCEQNYRRGRQHLKVQVVDYNGAEALFAGATALMSPDIWQENDEQLMRGCNLGLPGVRGYETVQKMEHRAVVALGVGNRFFVSVESTGQEDTQLVKAVARTLDLRGLAAL